MAPWTKASVTCPGFALISVVQCDGYCQNPVTGERLTSYHVEEILQEIYLRKHDGNLVPYDIPVACKCVSSQSSNVRKSKTPMLSIGMGDLMGVIAQSKSNCCPCSSVHRRR